MQNYLWARILFSVTVIFALAIDSRAATTWTTHGPGYKVIKAISISPQDTSIVFAGAFGWGVFKTTNGGLTWSNSRVGLTNAYVRSIEAISSTVVFCGTNDGVFKSIDGGATWSLSLTTPFSVRSLAYDNQSTNIYAATFGSGLFKSTNQGVSWSQIIVTDTVVIQTLSHLWSIALFGRDSLYVGGSILDVTTGGALFRSLDGGSTWIQVQRVTHIGSSVHSIAVNPVAPDMNLIIGTAAKGVYRSTNAGLTWSNISDTGKANTLPDFHTNAVAFNTNDRYAGTDSLGGFYSRSPVDAATGWTTGTGLPGAPAMVSSISINTVNRSTVYLGTEGQGVYRSSDAGLSWSGRNSGMLGIAAREIRRNGNGELLLGTDFGDGIWRSTDQGNSWIQSTSLATSNAITAIAITNNSSIVYAAAYGSGVYKSVDGGINWTITDSTVINHFVRTLEAVPATNDRLYAGTGNGVYKTLNGGVSWQASSAGIPASTSIRSMVIDPVNTNNIYVGTDSLFMYKSTDAGTSWTHITSANGFLPQDIFIRTITIDYATSTTLYAGADSGRIYMSTNSGTSWVLRTQLAATHSVRNVLIHPNDHRFFFAATFGDGIFVSADSGSHWQAINTGLGDLDIYTLDSDPSTPLRLYAGSSDLGVYQTLFDATNHKPVIAPIGAKAVLAGQILSFTLSATDPDATIPSLSGTGFPAGASFVDSLNGHGLFTWNPGIGQLGDYVMTMHASDGSLSDSQQVVIHVLDPATSTVVPYTAEAGWNLISVPVVVGDPRKASILPAGTSQAFAYSGSYNVKDTLQNGEGFWIKFPGAHSGTYSGGTIDRESVSVRTNWNMIGSISHILPLSAIVPIPPAALASRFYGYNAAGGYFAADSLRPGRGYWLKMTQGGAIVLGPAPISTPTAVPGLPRASSIDEKTVGTLTLMNRAGEKRQLYLLSAASSPESEAEYELPPRPPSGSFDLRFLRTQSMAVVLRDGNRKYPLQISGQHDDYSLSWNIVGNNISLELVVNTGEQSQHYRLEGNGAVDLSLPSTDVQGMLMTTVSGPHNDPIPRDISLSQNFPNPFNPSTVIGYALPYPAVVKLVVFDLLGRQVAQLVAGEQPAGYHSVTWDASNVSSGVYYYRLEAIHPSDHANDFRQIKKMFLIR